MRKKKKMSAAQQSTSVCVLHECKRLLYSRALGLFKTITEAEPRFPLYFSSKTQNTQKLTILHIYDCKIAIIGQFGEFQKLWILC